MKVKKDDRVFVLEFETDNGGCCGYADIESTLKVDLYDTCRNPVVTKVEYKEQEDEYSGESLIITLFGEDLEIADIEASAGSGSGWSYGAYAKVVCKDLDLDECLASW